MLITLLLLAAPAFARDLFLPLEDYALMTGTERRAYVEGFRKAVVQFEHALAAEEPVARGFSLLEEAYAAAPRRSCFVGGVIMRRGNGPCNTFGRACGSGGDTFRCGKIFGEACIDRLPTSTISERCDAAAPKDLSVVDYARVAPVIERGIAEICVGGRTSSRSCGIVRDQMAKLNEGKRKTPEPDPNPPRPEPIKPEPGKPEPLKPEPLKLDHLKIEPPQPEHLKLEPRKLEPLNTEPTRPEPQNSDTKPEPWKNPPIKIAKFNAVKPGACQQNRDQGEWGTCHAFCLACVYDNAMANATGNTDFKVSANWMAMLSVIQRVCDDRNSAEKLSDDILKEGWFPHDNLQNLAYYGACSEKSYKPYKGAKNWAAQFRASGEPFNPKEGRMRGLNLRPTYSEKEEANWMDKFGIKPGHAYDLFCPGAGKMDASAKGYEDRLKKMKGNFSPEFQACAEEALKNKARLQLPTETPGCDVEFVGTSDKPEETLKKMLHQANGPIPAVIKTSTAGHGSHCVTLSGYDDEKKVFTTVNSWGNNTSYNEIPYAKAKETFSYTAKTTCPLVSQNGGSPRREAELRPTTSSR